MPRAPPWAITGCPFRAIWIMRLGLQQTQAGERRGDVLGSWGFVGGEAAGFVGAVAEGAVGGLAAAAEGDGGFVGGENELRAARID